MLECLMHDSKLIDIRISYSELLKKEIGIEITKEEFIEFIRTMSDEQLTSVREVDMEFQKYLLNKILRAWFEDTYIYKKYGKNSNECWTRLRISAMALDEKLSHHGCGVNNFKRRLHDFEEYYDTLMKGFTLWYERIW